MSDPIHPISVIIKKRDGHELSQREIQHIVRTVVLNGEHKLNTNLPPLPAYDTITDAQIASFLMAVFQKGLTRRELADLTAAMRYSGETFDAGVKSLNTFTVDKHSTGGVGDKTSLLIAPIIAAAGCDSSISLPMISGRSLGHTGGTLDKLETIPGFNTQIPVAQMIEVLKKHHAVLIGQTPSLVPADRILYAMRDHTGTVESPNLICASIMSKKLAESLNALVLDVKVGSGAFMPTYEASKHLAELMVSTGEYAGTKTVALLTTMDEPLGRYSGNWVEVRECVDILQGCRHPLSSDLISLSLQLSGWILYLAGKAPSAKEGAELADQILNSGKAYDSWCDIIQAQGGDISIFNLEKLQEFHKPTASRVLKAEKAGYLSSMDCMEIGWAVQRLGAGRTKPGDPVSAHAGIETHRKLGDYVEKGDPIFTLFSEDEALLNEPFRMLQATVGIEDSKPLVKQDLVREVILAKDVQVSEETKKVLES